LNDLDIQIVGQAESPELIQKEAFENQPSTTSQISAPEGEGYAPHGGGGEPTVTVQ